MNGYISSYDIGTSGVKVALVDLEGNVCGIATASYGLISPHTGWGEQDPEVYWDAVCSVTKEVLRKTGIAPETVRGVVFSTQWKAAIPVDENGKVLHNAVLWLDGRAGKQAEKINERLGRPGLMCERDYWPRLMWFKEERPEIYEKAVSFLEVNSFLRFRATGEKYFDLTNDFIHSYDPAIQSLYDAILDAAELDRDKFPPMILPTDPAGKISAAGAAALGLCEGTPVFGGGGDIPAIAIGSGTTDFEKGHIYLGSSGWFCKTFPGRIPGVGEQQLSLYVGKELAIWGLQSVGMSLNWAIDTFYHKEHEELGDGVYDMINAEAAAAEPGCLGLIATSWLHGERAPLSGNAGCIYFNARERHERKHMIRAMMEAVCYMLRWKLEYYTDQTGDRPEVIRCVGGGSCSDPWMQAMADILGVRIEVPKNPRHVGAVGGAYCALIGLGLVKDFAEADKKITAERVFVPREEFSEMYRKQFAVYKELFPRMKDLFDSLNE